MKLMTPTNSSFILLFAGKKVIGLELEFDGSLFLSGQAIVKIN
ncbi:TPA: hypothetical protein ACXDAZ_003810 [Clostridium botulinum]|nr:hypothetical protein [Clostridium botulinum]EPS54976.1 hypothetical protein CLQ_05638 [Clostridium botulinum Af84]MCS4447299.1 hypothetical protein [Clostridium botulinum]MCS4457539.1 hypothetical protein [Clostridium botulinum]MCS4462714.1 hypothetical protein [Clostridium botulinum]MCS4515219.1 hypothetical protein [Clostridium botulinum]